MVPCYRQKSGKLWSDSSGFSRNGLQGGPEPQKVIFDIFQDVRKLLIIPYAWLQNQPFVMPSKNHKILTEFAFTLNTGLYMLLYQFKNTELMTKKNPQSSTHSCIIVWLSALSIQKVQNCYFGLSAFTPLNQNLTQKPFDDAVFWLCAEISW